MMSDKPTKDENGALAEREQRIEQYLRIVRRVTEIARMPDKGDRIRALSKIDSERAEVTEWITNHLPPETVSALHISVKGARKP